ncbi:MAG: nicotinate-nucleotide--dimethylbenzimidazole phosphoribosyltransferase [Sphaerochaetaceae bacterium]|nr:nicotinate-nucleotide--dimethylbenzimidazole phosphoribosyltransferase [Sphaerochaetaceae bacterium]
MQGRVELMSTPYPETSIDSPDQDVYAAAQRVWATRVKPPGSFGVLESAISRLCAIRGSLSPRLSAPAALLFAGDHHIITEGVSNSLQEVTWQQTLNFSRGKGAFGILCALHGFTTEVIDVGVCYDFPPQSTVLDFKIAEGASNFLKRQALVPGGALRSLETGYNAVERLESDCTVLIPAEMGVGNTTSAAALTSLILSLDSSETVGRGAGLSDEQLGIKRKVVAEAVRKYCHLSEPLDILTAVGGYEIGAMAGAMLGAAHKKMVILLDGYVASSALLIASAIDAKVSEYVIAGHLGSERGQKHILEHFGLHPLLSLGMFPGEGAGALLAYPLLSQAMELFRSLESFEQAQVSDRANRLLAGDAFV